MCRHTLKNYNVGNYNNQSINCKLSTTFINAQIHQNNIIAILIQWDANGGLGVLQSLSLQSAFYLRFAVCSLPSVLPRPAVCSLRFTLADETQPQVSFPKAICLPEIYKRSRLFSEPFRRKYRKYQASQVPIKSTKTNRIFISCLFFLHFYRSTFKMSAKLNWSRGFYTNFQVRQWTTNQIARN